MNSNIEEKYTLIAPTLNIHIRYTHTRKHIISSNFSTTRSYVHVQNYKLFSKNNSIKYIIYVWRCWNIFRCSCVERRFSVLSHALKPNKRGSNLYDSDEKYEILFKIYKIFYINDIRIIIIIIKRVIKLFFRLFVRFFFWFRRVNFSLTPFFFF